MSPSCHWHVGPGNVNFWTMKCMKTRLTGVLFFGWLGLFLAAPSTPSAEWSRWRGPNLNGISDEDLRLQAWPPQGPQRLWTNSVRTGFSSIAVSQGRLYTLGNSNETDTVLCLSADTGRVLWKHSYACPLHPEL